MFSKQQFLESVAHETAVCKHLFGLIPDGGLDHALGESMRTTKELLAYLTRCASTPAWASINEAWDRIAERLSAAEDLTPQEFPAKMDAQLEELRELLVDVSDLDLRERKVALPWGSEQMLGAALVNTSLKFLTAYRMQLFLHVKSMPGMAELSTHDCWLGRSKPA